MKIFISLIEEQDFKEFAATHDLTLSVLESYVRRGHPERFTVFFDGVCIEGWDADSSAASGSTINDAVGRYSLLIEARRLLMPRKKGQRKRDVFFAPRLNFNGNLSLPENSADGISRIVFTDDKTASVEGGILEDGSGGSGEILPDQQGEVTDLTLFGLLTEN